MSGRLCAIVVAIAVALFLVPPAQASAAVDDSLPGGALSPGLVATGLLSQNNSTDVYAVTLTAGEEIHVTCDPGRVDGSTGFLHLLVPGVTDLDHSLAFDEVVYRLRGGKQSISWADYDYIPARSGTYHLWVEWEAGLLDYSLSFARTSRAALVQTTDSDDIPGTSLGLTGVARGVVSTLADPNDVYGVALTAGQTVSIRAHPIGPYFNTLPARAHLYLLAPQTPSLGQRFGHVLDGLVPVVNSRDDAQRTAAEIVFTPETSGTYYVWVEAGSVYSYNVAYRLTVRARLATFSDVAGSPYEDAIYELADEGVITGYEDGTFRPETSVSRQQFAKMMVKTLGMTPTGQEVNPFRDVSGPQGTDPFYPEKYVAVCSAAGIIQGYPGGLFKPDDPTKRMQLITMVTRAAQLPATAAEVVPPFGVFDDTHYPFARSAYGAGLLAGLVGMGPDYPFLGPASRGECARLLANLLHTR